MTRARAWMRTAAAAALAAGVALSLPAVAPAQTTAEEKAADKAAAAQEKAEKAAERAKEKAEQRKEREAARHAPKPPTVFNCAPMDRIDLLAESGPARIVFDKDIERLGLIGGCGQITSEQISTALADNKRLILLADDLRAKGGGAYTLQLAPPTVEQARGDDLIAGTFGFSGAPGPAAAALPRRMSFDITKTVRALVETGHVVNGLNVLIKPSSPPPPKGAELSIGRLILIAQ